MFATMPWLLTCLRGACKQVGVVVGMQSQPQVVQPMEVLLLAITPTAHPPRWVLQEQQPPMMLASSVDKQAIGREIAQVGTFTPVGLHYIVASAAAIVYVQTFSYQLLQSVHGCRFCC